MVEENSLFNEDDYVDDPNKLTEKDIPNLIWMFEKRLQNLNKNYVNNSYWLRLILVIVLIIQTVIFGICLSY